MTWRPPFEVKEKKTPLADIEYSGAFGQLLKMKHFDVILHRGITGGR